MVLLWRLARCNLGFRREGDFVSFLFAVLPGATLSRRRLGCQPWVAWQGCFLVASLLFFSFCTHALGRRPCYRASAEPLGFKHPQKGSLRG